MTFLVLSAQIIQKVFIVRAYSFVNISKSEQLVVVIIEAGFFVHCFFTNGIDCCSKQF